MIKKSLKRATIFRLAGLVFIVIAIIYFNRAYAYIYNHIDHESLKAPVRVSSYLVSNNKMASSSLTYVALGDSLTAGVGANKLEEAYPYLLAKYFAGNNYQINVKLRVVPGAKTRDLVNGLLPRVINDNPDIVTVLIGVNDIHGEISKSEFRKNYDEILSRLTKETKAKIYVVSIPYIGASNLLLPPYNYIFDSKTKDYNKIVLELSEKYGLKYIDLYTKTESLFKESGSHYSADFFHPSAEGYKIWSDLIYADITN